eukprot:TRINITY_DN1405_c0_g1_i7.p1 TRINITY_DN1405_c0_g1~~TRINITY_DN1405_c0_g1_i7.p1  ORF type:complete len:396 (-),score=63.53 TRINITY_DN1405_c0_g1_i7:175-1362(-)
MLELIFSVPLWITLLCLAVPFLYWFYYWFFSGPSFKKFPGFDTHRETFNLHRAKVFPPPYPNGWYKIASFHEIQSGKIKSVSAFGEELVVFMGKDDQVVVLDAFCPHQGAHLGGGKVVDGCIQCPFHQWKFDANGKACEIPYFTGQKIPDFATTRTWVTRVIHQFIFVWFHADGESPTWDLIDRSYWMDKKKWYYFGTFQSEFAMHVMEMAENSPDYPHFNVVHKPLPIPFFGKFLRIEFFDFSLTFDKDPAKEHIHYFHNKANMYFLDKKLDGYPPQATDLTFEGPSVVIFHLNTLFGKAELYKNILPIAPFQTYCEDHWFAETTVPRWFLWIYSKFAAYALEQDRPIWNSKTYRNKPALVSGDGPWPQHRRWWNQFYSKSSYRIDGNSTQLDW